MKETQPKTLVLKIRKFFYQSITVLLFMISLLGTLFSHRAIADVEQQSDYAIRSQAPFNQPSYYPVQQTFANSLYQPTANWVGRLILPTRQESQDITSDWVWIEIYQTPKNSQNLVGKVLRLEWKPNAAILNNVKTLITDVKITSEAIKSQQEGNIIPTRLNERSGVGPLQSLAGARPNDDVIVSLETVTLNLNNSGLPSLQIEQEPLQITGRFYGLFQILGTNSNNPEQFRVRPYNRNSQQFDAPETIIRIPQQPATPQGLFPSTPQQIEDSPVGKAGWYLYGAKDQEGMFTVQGIQPRSAFQLKPDQIVLGERAGLHYLADENWKNTEEQKGTVKTVLIDPTVTTSDEALADWKEGDYGIVIHLFGAIGGENGDRISFGTVTGHFSYGIAQVVREPLTNELQFKIIYQQVYAHNPNGIIAGSQSWVNYMGNLERGWLGTRPVSDIIIKLDAVTQDYNFNGIIASPLKEFTQQLQIMMARYRTGDGTGVAQVTPATSCVQDSSQALYIAIEQIKQKISSNPEILTWLKEHPNDPQTLRFQQLVALGTSLESLLKPHGVVRSDWKNNAEYLAGINSQNGFIKSQRLLSSLLSWRSLFPRRAHDEVSSVFLQHGAKLWIIRTNQVGGWDQEIFPVAPTVLFGQFPIIPSLIHRLAISVHPLGLSDGLIIIGALVIYSLIALPFGFSSGFLTVNLSFHNLNVLCLGIAHCFIRPALVEEIIFRILPLPHPSENVLMTHWLLWAILSLMLFILYHPINAFTFYKLGNPTFCQRPFLILAGLLGVICTLAYGLTGSLWVIVIIHWVIVVVWIFGLGGKNLLSLQPTYGMINSRKIKGSEQ